MIISEYIYKIMEERGLSQKEFSEKTGISQSTISDWRRKKTNPSVDKIMVICEVLDISPYELLQCSDIENDDNDNDYIIIYRGSDTFELVREFTGFKKSQRDRLMGYMNALKDLKK